jgi:hydroxyacylglutathione hydrolase
MMLMTAGHLEVRPLSAFSDNYIWLLLDHLHQRCAVVDPGDARPVVDWLEAHPQWSLSDVLVTHHHSDHVDGIEELKQGRSVRVIGPWREHIPGCDLALDDGDQIEVLGHHFLVIGVPGHTLGHIAYFLPDQQPLLFSGDTLFAGGCGRLFEGTAAQMMASLERLADLPKTTNVYCAHEYTLSNLRFAQTVEPGNRKIAQRLRKVELARSQGECTLPSRIDLELQTNPFLRTANETVRAAAQAFAQVPLTTPEACLGALREWKNDF